MLGHLVISFFLFLCHFALSFPIESLDQTPFSTRRGDGETEMLGWMDPRIGGGRLLDVSYLLLFVFAIADTISPVHQSGLRRTSECYHIWNVGSFCSDGLWLSLLRKVRPVIFLYGTGLLANRRSIGYSDECLGLHYGHIHEADLGDGDGRKSEQFLARQYYFPVWGTCWESLAGSFASVTARSQH